MPYFLSQSSRVSEVREEWCDSPIICLKYQIFRFMNLDK